MNYRQGNLIQLAKSGEFDLIAHGCNCFCNFGAGIAAAIRHNFPEVYYADLHTVRGDRGKLGRITYHVYNFCVVVNCYTQHRYGRGGPHLDYHALKSCMYHISDLMITLPRLIGKKRIGLPLIGCGLAGGNWDKVSAIIEKELSSFDVTIVKLD